jgi:hypothetical protein
MQELQGPPAELRLTVNVKRAATGQTETHELVGHVIHEPESQNGSDTQHGSAGRRD